MIIVSPETHSSLFLIKGERQKKVGKNITLDEIMKLLIMNWNNTLLDREIKRIEYQLEEKE